MMRDGSAFAWGSLGVSAGGEWSRRKKEPLIFVATKQSLPPTTFSLVVLVA